MNDHEQFQQFMKDKDTDMISDIMFGMTSEAYCIKHRQCDFSLTMTDYEWKTFKKMSEWLAVMRYDGLSTGECRYKLTAMFIDKLAEEFYQKRIEHLKECNETMREILDGLK